MPARLHAHASVGMAPAGGLLFLEKVLTCVRLFRIIRYMAKYRNKLSGVSGVLKALAEENRLRVVMCLAEHGELCVCQITEFLGLAPSTVSKHLSILRAAGLIESRKIGRWVHYRFADSDEGAIVRNCLGKWLADDKQIYADGVFLEKILKEDPEQLCLRQKKK